ncbi:MAG: DUF2332 domain-containing protein [Novosphingobium sp.]|nr:DUF2332 domain-containing protein [Novosphingobium sp.]MBO9600959.1 DUF2332 domain-containing protein [Novosphingobium sp.]
MAIPEVDVAIEWQAAHAEKAGAPCTGRIVRSERAMMQTATEVGRRIREWEGLTLEAAMPLRIAGGIHHLFLTGDAPELAAVYAGEVTDQDAVDRIVVGLVERFDARLSPWLDGPPQTNEAGRSASIMAGLLWLSRRLGPRFELNEIGASAGVNTMMERYFYDLGGVEVGPADSPMRIAPKWRGGLPLAGKVEIVSIRGSDIAPVDLADPAQALRLKAYVWADAKERMQRIDAAIRLASEKRPDLVEQDAGAFVAELVERPQAAGVTRVLYHSVMWQYLPVATRDAIAKLMEAAGQAATPDRPLAWIRLETNRETFAHELTVKYWPGSSREWTQLTQAHPHGAWVEWVGQ